MSATATKGYWQTVSLVDLTEADEGSFMRVISEVPEGVWFSVNELRARLDACEVPPGQRGGLFAAACKAGLIEPVVMSVHGITVPLRVPSTGATAHQATVQMYQRLPARADAEQAPP